MGLLLNFAYFRTVIGISSDARQRLRQKPEALLFSLYSDQQASSSFALARAAAMT